MSAMGHVISRLTFREKLLVSLAAAMALFSMGSQFIFEPLGKQYSTKQLQLKKVIDQKEILVSRVKKIDDIRAVLRSKNIQSAALKRELAVLDGSMTQSDQVKSVLGLLEEMAREADMSLLNIEVNPNRATDAPTPLFNVNKITLSVKSSYRSLALFMRKLSTLPIAMSISRIDISSDPMAKSSGVTARLNLKLYSSL